MTSNAINFVEKLWQQGLEFWLEGEQLGFRGNKKLLTENSVRQLKEYKSEIVDFISEEPLAFQGFPLSEGQKGIYMSQQLALNSPLYNLSCCIHLNNPVDTDALQSALNTLSKRHPALSASFHQTSTHVSQIWHFERAIALQHEKLNDDSDLKTHLNKKSDKAFLLGSDTLFKAYLFQQGSESYLAVVTHHIVADFWALQTVLTDLQNCYQALITGKSPEKEPEKTFKEFIIKEQQYLQSSASSEAEDYWKNILNNDVEPLILPQYQRRPKKQSFQGDELLFSLSNELSDTLKRKAQENNVTPFIWLLSCYQCWLFKMSNSSKISLGIPVANRSDSKLQQVAGHFTNPLPLIADREACNDFKQLCKQNKTHLRQLFKRQQFPVECIKHKTGQLYQSAFSWNQLNEEEANHGILFKKSLYTLQRGAVLDLVLTAVDTTHEIKFALRYNSDIYNPSLMNRFREQFINIVSNSLIDEQSTFHTSFLTQQESNAYKDLNNKQFSISGHNNLAHRIDESAKKFSSKTAIEDDDGQHSYLKLQQRINDYAQYFLNENLQPKDNIALYLPRGLELLAACIATVKIGCSYMSIDLSYPVERITHMLSNTNCKAFLSDFSQTNVVKTLQQHNEDLQSIYINNIDTTNQNINAVEVNPDDIACVFFTSGSTGLPKAVAVPHKSVTRLSIDSGFLSLEPGDRMCHLSNVSFDAYNLEVWHTLFHGATLLTIDKDTLLTPKLFSQFIANKKPNAAFLTTALFNTLIEYQPDIFKTFKTLLFGGEAANIEFIKSCQQAGQPKQLFNLYGPTENGAISTHYLIPQLSNETSIPIGKSISNSESFIVDKENMLCPIGVQGELLVGGQGIAECYLKQEALSKEKFIPNFITESGKLYRSGDIAYLNEQGLICYAGREDSQIKIRGFRIELAEVEYALSSFSNIQQSCIDVRKDKQGNNYLAAFYTADKHLDNREIKEFLVQKLPDFMVPLAYKQLETFIMNANGKLDRKSLPETKLQQKTYVAPHSEIEITVCEVFQQAFDLKKVGIHDDFFELGGHSLLAVKIAGKLQKSLDVDITMRLIFENSDIESLSKVIEQLNKTSSPIQHISNTTKTTAALSQQRLWFLQELNQNSTAYNMPVAIEFPEKLNSKTVLNSLRHLIERHEALSYRFIDNNGIADIEKSNVSQELLVNEIDFRQLPQLQQEKETQLQIDQLSQTCFELDKGPLFKALMIRLSNNKTILAFCLHHIIADGWSVNILLQELGQLLKKPEHKLPEATINYMDFSAWQHNLLQGDYLNNQLSFWQQQLHGASASLNLPLDKPRPAQLSSNGSEYTFKFNSENSQAIRTFAQKNNTTSFMVLIAAYNFLLAKYTGDKDICVGFPISGREQSSIEPLVGLFVNNLVLRHQHDFNNSITDYIHSIKKTMLDVYAHQSLPFDMIIDGLAIERSLSYTPFLQASFSLEETDLEQGLKSALGQDVKLREMNWHVAKYDIHLSCYDNGNGDISAQIEYNSHLFFEKTIEQIAQHFSTVVNAFCTQSQQPLKRIQLLSADEVSEQLSFEKGLNATQFNYPKFTSVHEIFEQQALNNSDTAIADQEHSLSYEQLNQKSNQLAHFFIEKNVSNNDTIAIIMERSCELSITLLATLKAGACYVPILPETPTERIQYILTDTDAKFCITQEHLKENLRTLKGEILAIDTDSFSKQLKQQAEYNPNIPSSSKDLFNIIYTSGSTGNPKGVMVPHQGIINRLQWMQHKYKLTNKDTVLQKTPFNFDVSAWELFWPLLEGAKLSYAKPEGHKDPDYLRDKIQQDDITVLHFVPSMLGVFLQSDNIEQCTSIKKVFTSGEALQIEHSEHFFQRLNFSELHNLYGPTEASIDVSYYACTANEQHGTIPIGKPIHNTQLIILDDELNLLPKGAVGELYIGGKNLASGYLNQADLSQQSFIDNPFLNKGLRSKKLYKSGDMARYLHDGNIEYLGRVDHQVKIRGLRIELQEIEQQLRKIDNVQQAVVITADINQHTQIIAFIQGPNDIDKHAYHHILQQQLPEYMLPFAYIPIDKVPLSANGKIDRKRLPIDQINTLTQTRIENFVAPRNDTESQLQAIWQEILQVDDIGIHDNFFELGGHSLLATRLASKVRSEFSCALELKAIFDHPTIADISVLILEQAIETLDIDDEDLLKLLNEIDDELE